MKYYNIIALFLIVCQSISAYDFSAGNADGVTLYYKVLADSTKCALASGGEPYTGDIVIPSFVSFGKSTFQVVAIGDDAFLGSEDLASVVIPKGVTTIGGFAFSCCSSLKTVALPDGVTTVGAYAFSGCTQLKGVTLPKTVDTLCDFAFYGCTRLASVDIQGKPDVVGYNVFSGTAWWDGQPQGVVYYDDILLGCHGDIHHTQTVREGTRIIANGAFYERCGLTWIDLPNSVLKIGSSAFYGCSGLTAIVLPEKVREIEEYSFFRCNNLLSVELPDSLRSIGWYAFSGCTSLSSLSLPDCVSDIGAEAFRGCVNLVNVSCRRRLPPSCYANAFIGVSRSACSLYVLEDAISSYLAEKPWNEFNIITPYDFSVREKCATPVITVNEGRLNIVSATDGAKCHYTIASSDMQSSDIDGNSTVNLSGQYNITAYAKAEGMLNSDIASAILVWVNPEQLYDNIINMEQTKAVVLRIDGGNAVLCGTEVGEEMCLYSSSGAVLVSLKAASGETVIPYSLQKGQVYIVQYANRGIKFVY